MDAAFNARDIHAVLGAMDAGYGRGLAEATRADLDRRGVTKAIYEQITPGEADYSEPLARLEAAGMTCCSTAATSPKRL